MSESEETLRNEHNKKYLDTFSWEINAKYDRSILIENNLTSRQMNILQKEIHGISKSTRLELRRIMSILHHRAIELQHIMKPSEMMELLERIFETMALPQGDVHFIVNEWRKLYISYLKYKGLTEFNEIHIEKGRAQKIEKATEKWKSIFEGLGVDRTSYGDYKYVVSHVQTHEPPDSIVQYDDWLRKAWIDIMCDEPFNPKACYKVYHNNKVLVYDELLWNVNGTLQLILAINLCEWGTRGWIFQERVLASELLILTKNNFSKLYVMEECSYCHGLSQQKYKMETQHGELDLYLPGISGATMVRGARLISYLVRLKWTFPQDVVHAYNLLTGCSFVNGAELIKGENMLNVLFAGYGAARTNGWGWVSDLNNTVWNENRGKALDHVLFNTEFPVDTHFCNGQTLLKAQSVELIDFEERAICMMLHEESNIDAVHVVISASAKLLVFCGIIRSTSISHIIWKYVLENTNYIDFGKYQKQWRYYGGEKAMIGPYQF